MGRNARSERVINMLSHYTFTLAEQVTKGQLRPLKQAEESNEWAL